MTKDIWHYPRTELAKQILDMFETGISSALTFFAPRRMGKTEFLLKDIQPIAEKRGWKIFYFSFLDAVPTNEEFLRELISFSEQYGIRSKVDGALHRISKIGGKIGIVNAGIELQTQEETKSNIKEAIGYLASKKNRVLLLLDEVQILAKNEVNINLIAGLRTALDMYKDTIKVIFTGSSQEGLKRMFSERNAPFFHFGQNLPFPELDKGFTDHLSTIFKLVTGRKLDNELLWNTFQTISRVPQLARSLVERLALNPDLTIDQVKEQMLTDIFDDRNFVITWTKCSQLEKILLYKIACNNTKLFSIETIKEFVKETGIDKLNISSVQSTIRTLLRKQLIGRLLDRRGYFIDDPNFKNWVLSRC